MSAISKVTTRLEEAGELLERAIAVTFLAACLVVIPCVAAVLVFFTFAAIHPGDDVHINPGSGGGAGGESSDVIVLPTQLF